MGAVLITIETNGKSLPDSIPKGWRTAANNPPDVVIVTDTLVRHSGKASGCIYRPLALKRIPGSAFFLQSIAAVAYRNTRVKFSIYVRSKEVEGAFLYFRVDGQDSVLTYANTFFKDLIVESADWTLYHIVLDVPEQSMNMEFGVILTGQGTIWMDDCNLEVVNQNVPSDDWMIYQKQKPAVTKKNYEPNTVAMNLGFEDR